MFIWRCKATAWVGEHRFWSWCCGSSVCRYQVLLWWGGNGKTLCSIGFIECAIWSCGKSISGNLWASPHPLLILPIIYKNNSWTCKKTSMGILLSSWIAIICMWNLRISPKKFEYKSRYLKEQVHSDNLPRFVQAGVGLTAASLSPHFMTSPVVACSCVWVCLAQVCCRTEEKWKNPNSQLALDIRLFWQSFYTLSL